MRPKLLLRIAAFLVLFVAVGHTIGNCTRKVTTDPAQQEVIKKMEDFKFDFAGSTRSWDIFYEGSSLDISITLVVFTILLWVISSAAGKYPGFCVNLLWPVLLCFIGFTVTGFMYFFWVPAVSTLLASGFIILAMLQLKKLSNNITS